jgi:hypothetical protein
MPRAASARLQEDDTVRRPYLPDKAREHLMGHIQNWLRICDVDDLQELFDLIQYGGKDDPGALTPEVMRASWHAWLDTASDDQIVQFHHDLMMGTVAGDIIEFVEDDGISQITSSA